MLTVGVVQAALASRTAEPGLRARDADGNGILARVPLVSELLIASSSGSSPRLWQTALVASGSAIGGALVGGVVAYRGNVLLQTKQRRLRAAVRRKAKVYVPLKLELQALSSAIAVDEHVAWGISEREDDKRHSRAPRFRFWGVLVEDGRALFAVSNAVRRRMEALAEAVRELERVRSESGRVFQEVGQSLYRELSGNPVMNTGFGSYGMAGPLRDSDGPWRDWEHADASRFPEFRATFNESLEVQRARADLLGAETLLLGALRAAETALDDGITRISKREEQESPRD